jgi:hypothetical protein
MKRLTSNMKNPDGREKPDGAYSGEATARRGWMASLVLAGAIVAVGIGLSAVINPLLGRYVHWDWVAVLAPTLLIALTIALRRRWV